MDQDAQLVLCTAQAFSADAASQNVINLSAVRGIGPGKLLAVILAISVDADHTTGDEKYRWIWQESTDEAFSSPLEVCKWELPYAVLLEDTVHELVIPSNNQNMGAFGRLYFDGDGTTPTVIASARLGIAGEFPNITSYPSGSPFATGG